MRTVIVRRIFCRNYISCNTDDTPFWSFNLKCSYRCLNDKMQEWIIWSERWKCLGSIIHICTKMTTTWLVDSACHSCMNRLPICFKKAKSRLEAESAHSGVSALTSNYCRRYIYIHYRSVTEIHIKSKYELERLNI